MVASRYNRVGQTARRVLTVLERGQYFGESGVLTYFNGGGKGSGGPPAVTEQFSLFAATHVELLVLRRKHYNIIEMQVVEDSRGVLFASFAALCCIVLVHTGIFPSVDGNKATHKGVGRILRIIGSGKAV